MRSVVLQFDINTLNKSDSGSITSIIYLDFDDFSFPEKDWDDFTVVILGWWINELISLINNEKDSAVCDFMDGSFSYKVEKTENDTEAIIYLIERESVIYTAKINVYELFLEIKQATNRVLGECFMRGWVTDDVENLQCCFKKIDSKIIKHN